MSHSKQQPILSLAVATGALLLEHGAETYRVEETITRMLQSRGIETESFATPSVIIVTGFFEAEPVTIMRRIKTKSIDLHMIDEVNMFAREFSQGTMALDQAQTTLHQLSQGVHYPTWIQLVGGGICAGGFAVFFGAPWISLPIGFVFGVIIRWFLMFSEPFRLNFFIRNLIGTLMITTIIHLTNKLIPIDVNAMIIGSIMQLVPGVAITNSVRDTLSGDFLSGMTRAMEAIFIALGIAFGVGIALMLMTGVNFL